MSQDESDSVLNHPLLVGNGVAPQQQAQNVDATIPAIVHTAKTSVISKLTGICKEYGVCDCSHFEDATEIRQETTFELGSQNIHESMFGTRNHGRRIQYLSRQFHQSSLQTRPIGIFCIAAVVSILFLVFGGTKSAQIDRFDRLQACAKRLVLGLECPQTPASEMIARCNSLSWFLGPGRNIELSLSNDQQCSWDTDFGMLFSLIIVRETLGVLEPSWHTTVPLHHALEVCDWKRIGCDDKGVSALYFNNAGLNGTIPAEIAGLRHLRELWAYTSHGLVGTIPTEIGRMKSLENLELHQTSLAGTIPTELGQLSGLKTLFLDGTLLQGAMPEQVCALRASSLDFLHANCKGEHPMVSCSCCTSCKRDIVDFDRS